MSCKYCELKMRPIDGGIKALKGENWTDECNEGGYIEQFYDDKFRMHINYDAGYAYTSVNNIKYCPFCGAELTIPKEPLIKDEKIRKAVRAWAAAANVKTDKIRVSKGTFFTSFIGWIDGLVGGLEISFRTGDAFEAINDGAEVTLAELCGEEEE